MPQEKSAGGIVHNTRTKKILLIKDQNGKWAIPKGHIEEGETEEDAAVREVREETGIKSLKIIKNLGATEYFYMRDNQTIRKTNIVFLMETRQEELKPQWEIKDAKWFAPESIFTYIGYKNLIPLLRKALEEIKKT